MEEADWNVVYITVAATKEGRRKVVCDLPQQCTDSPLLSEKTATGAVSPSTSLTEFPHAECANAACQWSVCHRSSNQSLLQSPYTSVTHTIVVLIQCEELVQPLCYFTWADTWQQRFQTAP